MMQDEFTGRVYIKELKEYFHLDQVSGDEESLKRWAIVPDINRPGLELSGYVLPNDLKRVIIIGNKEIQYIQEMGEEIMRERFNAITDSFTPCIIFAGGNKVPPYLLELARAKNFPVFESANKTYRVITDVVAFLDKKLAPSESCHGVMMNVYGTGVLLMGPSGIGKSELALELISRGHSLVSDDRVDVIRAHNDLVCFPPEVLKGMLEIRGIGIVDVGLMFGTASVLDSSTLDLVIKLEPFNPDAEYDRLSIHNKKMTMFGLEKPLLEIPVKEGRAMSVIVEAAVMNYRLREQGIDSGQKLRERVIENIRKREGEL